MTWSSLGAGDAGQQHPHSLLGHLRLVHALVDATGDHRQPSALSYSPRARLRCHALSQRAQGSHVRVSMVGAELEHPEQHVDCFSARLLLLLPHLPQQAPQREAANMQHAHLPTESPHSRHARVKRAGGQEGREIAAGAAEDAGQGQQSCSLHSRHLRVAPHTLQHKLAGGLGGAGVQENSLLDETGRDGKQALQPSHQSLPLRPPHPHLSCGISASNSRPPDDVAALVHRTYTSSSEGRARSLIREI
eukprot:768563-Hanusia_phi.AAC.3